jgi:hypothetical protein
VPRSNIGRLDVIGARAPTVEKLQTELVDLLGGYAPDGALGVSHLRTAVSSEQSGGVWGARQTHGMECSPIVLAQPSHTIAIDGRATSAAVHDPIGMSVSARGRRGAEPNAIQRVRYMRLATARWISGWGRFASDTAHRCKSANCPTREIADPLSPLDAPPTQSVQ